MFQCSLCVQTQGFNIAFCGLELEITNWFSLSTVLAATGGGEEEVWKGVCSVKKPSVTCSACYFSLSIGFVHNEFSKCFVYVKYLQLQSTYCNIWLRL